MRFRVGRDGESDGGAPKIGVEISRAGIYNVVVSARARDVAKDKEGL